MPSIKLLVTAIIVTLSATAFGAANVPTGQLLTEMGNFVSPLLKKEGWAKFIESHPRLFGNVSDKHPDSYLEVDDFTVNVNGQEYKIGMGARSIWINATPKTVVSVVNNPKFFKAMYGLDKPADVYPVDTDGNFKARIYKLVPGIETQDYTLDYKGHWDGDSWIQDASLVRDEKNFALRDNIKIIAPSGSGAIFREIALLYPMRWWMRLLHGPVQTIFKRELGKLNKSLKCAAEKVQAGAPMSDEIAAACYKESQ